jgi:hypothetical protein
MICFDKIIKLFPSQKTRNKEIRTIMDLQVDNKQRKQEEHQTNGTNNGVGTQVLDVLWTDAEVEEEEEAGEDEAQHVLAIEGVELKAEVLDDLGVEDEGTDHDKNGVEGEEEVDQGVVREHEEVEFHLEKVEFLTERGCVQLVVVHEVVLDPPDQQHDAHAEEGGDEEEHKEKEEIETHHRVFSHGLD